MQPVSFVKVIVDKKYGEVLAFIIGPAAAELINKASTIIEMEITVKKCLRLFTVVTQPSL